jgi:hypothetical protein
MQEGAGKVANAEAQRIASKFSQFKKQVEGYASFMANEDGGRHYEQLMRSEFDCTMRDGHDERCRLESVRPLNLPTTATRTASEVQVPSTFRCTRTG